MKCKFKILFFKAVLELDTESDPHFLENHNFYFHPGYKTKDSPNIEWQPLTNPELREYMIVVGRPLKYPPGKLGAYYYIRVKLDDGSWAFVEAIPKFNYI